MKTSKLRYAVSALLIIAVIAFGKGKHGDQPASRESKTSTTHYFLIDSIDNPEKLEKVDSLLFNKLKKDENFDREFGINYKSDAKEIDRDSEFPVSLYRHKKIMRIGNISYFSIFISVKNCCGYQSLYGIAMNDKQEIVNTLEFALSNNPSECINEIRSEIFKKKLTIHEKHSCYSDGGENGDSTITNVRLTENGFKVMKIKNYKIVDAQ